MLKVPVNSGFFLFNSFGSGAIMKKLLLSSSAFLALAGAVVLAHGPARAAPLDDLDREKAQLRKENADLRELLRMRDENAALRYRLGQQGVEAPAPLPVAQPSRPRAASPATPSGEASRAESTARRGAPSVFESYAADLPVNKAPAPVRAALYDWTGFYVGANIGYSVGNDRVSQTLTGPGVNDTTFTDAAVAPKGVLGGVQVGYNWQGGRNWLVGFETDFQAASQIDKACGIACVRSPPQELTFTVEQKLEYFGTVRARLGVVNDNVLFYATGGAAYGRVSETIAAVLNTGAAGSLASNVLGENHFGWTAGGGIEAALWGNWTAKAEYLYLNLGDMKPNVLNTILPNTPPTALTVGTTSTIRDHIVRAGINYRFGGDAPLSAYASARGAEAYAAYSPVYNWTGFYVGANAGYGAGVSHLSQVEGGGIGSTQDSVIAPKGFAGGLQVGYNWQGGRNWLVGFEADIQGTNQNDRACMFECLTGPTGIQALTAQQQLDWFGTVRGRLGFVNNNILFFATGGTAFGQVKETIAENLVLPGTANFTTLSNNFDQIGWTAGGGIEAALSGNWTAKAEYLYLDLGTIKSTFTDGATTTITNTTTVRDHIFRAGVNYRFSGEPGPLMARY
jgi:outer membrane immunogenic protein